MKRAFQTGDIDHTEDLLRKHVIAGMNRRRSAGRIISGTSRPSNRITPILTYYLDMSRKERAEKGIFVDDEYAADLRAETMRYVRRDKGLPV